MIGIPAAGKSTFYKSRFADTHMRLNMDMLRTRRKVKILLDACIEAKAPFVVDCANGEVSERVVYVSAAKAAGFRVVGYYFESRVAPAMQRNATREKPVPEKGILGQAGRLQRPSLVEGFDELFYVRVVPPDFEVSEWCDEV